MERASALAPLKGATTFALFLCGPIFAATAATLSERGRLTPSTQQQQQQQRVTTPRIEKAQ